MSLKQSIKKAKLISSSFGLFILTLGSVSVPGSASSNPVTWADATINVSQQDCSGISASTNTGQYVACASVIGGDIYVSNDYGQTWNDETSSGNNYWVDVAVSSTGQYMAAVAQYGHVYYSDNYGVDWTEDTSVSNHYWDSVAISGDGQTIYAADQYSGNLYISTDGGSSWNADLVTPSGSTGGLSVSSDGKYIVSGDGNGDLYTSSDYGQTWDDHTELPSNWHFSYTSPSGKYMVSSDNTDNYLYISDNYGQTWTADSVSGVTSPGGAMISSDGQTIIFADEDNDLNESFDGGQTWVTDTNLSTNGWDHITGSADMSKLVAIDDNGNVEYGDAPGLVVVPQQQQGNLEVSSGSGNSVSGSSKANSKIKVPDTGYGTPNNSYFLGATLLMSSVMLVTGGILAYVRSHKLKS